VIAKHLPDTVRCALAIKDSCLHWGPCRQTCNAGMTIAFWGDSSTFGVNFDAAKVAVAGPDASVFHDPDGISLWPEGAEIAGRFHNEWSRP
jgi:hypothetical protein